MRKLNLAIAVLAVSAASTTFAAPTGTITFEGQLVTGTCDATVSGTSPASPNGSFVLPTMHVDNLSAVDEVGGDTPFTIKLTGTGCLASTKIATPYFESEPAKINAQGRLKNTATATPATNVDIQLLTDDKTVIDLNEPANTQITTTGVANGTGINDFKYFARYYATGAATDGSVDASVSYSIFYK